MESKNEFKNTDIKNRTRYYFDYILKIKDIDFDNIVLDKNFYGCKTITYYV